MGKPVDFANMVQVLDLTNIVIHDEEGKILHWTTGCQRLYGWSGDEALGAIVHELLKTRYPLSRDDIITQVRKGGSWQGQIEQRRKDDFFPLGREPLGRGADRRWEDPVHPPDE